MISLNKKIRERKRIVADLEKQAKELDYKISLATQGKFQYVNQIPRYVTTETGDLKVIVAGENLVHSEAYAHKRSYHFVLELRNPEVKHLYIQIPATKMIKKGYEIKEVDRLFCYDININSFQDFFANLDPQHDDRSASQLFADKFCRIRKPKA